MIQAYERLISIGRLQACVLGCLTGFRLSLERLEACGSAGEGFKVCGLLFMQVKASCLMQV